MDREIENRYYFARLAAFRIALEKGSATWLPLSLWIKWWHYFISTIMFLLLRKRRPQSFFLFRKIVKISLLCCFGNYQLTLWLTTHTCNVPHDPSLSKNEIFTMVRSWQPVQHHRDFELFSSSRCYNFDKLFRNSTCGCYERFLSNKPLWKWTTTTTENKICRYFSLKKGIFDILLKEVIAGDENN